jgi:hypothetical protein
MLYHDTFNVSDVFSNEIYRHLARLLHQEILYKRHFLYTCIHNFICIGNQSKAIDVKEISEQKSSSTEILVLFTYNTSQL